MNDCVIKIIIYVIGSSKERLQHIQLYLHRSWCTHIHKKVSTFICILFVLSEHFSHLLREGDLAFKRSFKSCRTTALSSFCTKIWLNYSYQICKIYKNRIRSELSIPYYSGE